MNQNRNLPHRVRGGIEIPNSLPIGAAVGDRAPVRFDGAAQTARGFGIKGGVLAALYLPLQEFDGLYDPETALTRGTLFRELDKPFIGGKEGGCRGCAGQK